MDVGAPCFVVMNGVVDYKSTKIRYDKLDMVLLNINTFY